MSASARNCVYIFGKKREGKTENVLSPEEMEKIRQRTEKYFKPKDDKKQ